MSQQIENDNDLILRTKSKITSFETDINARLRLGALANLLIQSAIQSAENLGFGFGNLKENKLFWVLSRLKIEINRPMNWYEEVEVETWPKDIDGWFYLRDFIVRDSQGEIVAKATSTWLAIDIETKRPKKIEGIQAANFTRLRHKHAIEIPAEKLSAHNLSLQRPISIQFFDFDLNKHVTSTRYIDWMMDSLSFDFHNKNYAKSLIINYIKETLENKEIILHHHCDQNNTVFFEGIHKVENSVSVRAEVKFEAFNPEF